jgi:myo-inositol-1(or 4)-monophosphatase
MINPQDIEQLHSIDRQVQGWLQLAATQTKQHMADLTVLTKSNPRDLVTNVDKANEDLLVSKIRAAFPQAKIVSEEGFGDTVTDMTGEVWFIDPIDGTMNFVKEHENFAIMLGLYIDGQPVLGWIMDVMRKTIYHGGPAIGVFENARQLPPVSDDALAEGLFMISSPRLYDIQRDYWQYAKAALGVRMIGVSGQSFIRLIKGQAAAYLSAQQPWDFAAGVVLAKTMNLSVSQIDGKPLDMLKSNVVLVATSRAQADMLAMQ